jgi:hypothetical protein
MQELEVSRRGNQWHSRAQTSIQSIQRRVTEFMDSGVGTNGMLERKLLFEKCATPYRSDGSVRVECPRPFSVVTS